MKSQRALIFAFILATTLVMAQTINDDQAPSLSSTDTKFKDLESDANNTVQFTFGFVDALNPYLGLLPIDACVVASEFVIQDMKVGIQLIEEEEIVQALSMIGKGLEMLADDFSYCQELEGDVQVIKSVAKIFKDPKILVTDGENILINGAEIDQQIHTAIEAKKIGNIYGFGYTIGQIVGEASTGKPNPKAL